MKIDETRIFFDKRDHMLLNVVHEVLDGEKSSRHLENLLYPFLHPHGIKELAEPKGLRIAYATVRLLESLDSDKAGDRVEALRSLQDEVLSCADSHMRKNTARVLLQIMKELVRTRGDTLRQLELAHDFRAAVSGRPRVIRKLLKEYNLLEMPEEWNQLTFDEHVHDSYTKGRKSPSHLVMDAWIKGIRYLTVVYYNYADPAAVTELLKASKIMGIGVRVGIEYPARFHDRYVRMIWVPEGLAEVQDYESFLHHPRVEAFMNEGRRVSEYQEDYVFAILQEFNQRHRLTIQEAYGIDVPALHYKELLSFVGTGQPSILHLAKFIHSNLLPAMRKRVEALREEHAAAEPGRKKSIENLIKEMDLLDSEAIVDRFLRPVCNPSIPDSNVPRDSENCPELLRLAPLELIERLGKLHYDGQIILNLSQLGVEDVCELLFDCRGGITHLEIFNLKDHTCKRTIHLDEINELQRIVNEGNIIQLNQMVRRFVERLEAAPGSRQEERAAKFRTILRNTVSLKEWYGHKPLRSTIGSDSTGSSCRFHGMGLAVLETLPHRARREIQRMRDSGRPAVPLSVVAVMRTTFGLSSGFLAKALNRLLRFFSDSPAPGRKMKCEWEIQSASTRIEPDGNIVALGGTRENKGNGLLLVVDPEKDGKWHYSHYYRYLNGNLKNALKITVGFVPSVLTFMVTQDWWFLVWLGTPIWFGITGLRNILQSVFGGGGIHRTPLLKWKAYVNWDRVSDSLLYTGLSVPLLEYVVRVLLLERMLGITTSTDPLMLYSAMSLVNGFYIAGHNILRGLPRSAVVGNFFRSIINIPVSMAFDSAAGAILGLCGVVSVEAVLQQWASIISKASSDCVAGIIEGIADGLTNFHIRTQDYSAKINQVFRTFERLEIMFPEQDVLEVFAKPKEFLREADEKGKELAKIVVINALDLLYFWMYQPRARQVFRSLVRKMPAEDREILVRSHSVLRRTREVIDLFVNRLVGKSYTKPLSFYLEYHEDYLKALYRLGAGERGIPLLSFLQGGKRDDEQPASARLLTAEEGCTSK
ncbi:MAG: hypothetical protein ABFD98_10670 [Syntrophobacteraceae bacterium]|nr:hypothetical protein [Desulfobacteraceae bacterium]